MKIYFATWLEKNQLLSLSNMDAKSRLLSYYFFKDEGIRNYYKENLKMKKKVNLFLDSGAYSAWSKGIEINIQDYIKFIKKYERYIDHYAVLDSIGDPDLTLKNQKIMEKAGLNPIPCFHFGEDIKYLEKYIDKYDYIALGGMVPISTKDLFPWLSNLFINYLSDKKGSPKGKVHGFGLTSLKTVTNFPWYSVDSTSWVLTGRFGSVYVPIRKKGGYVYDENSLKICVSTQSPSQKEAGKHFYTLTNREKEEVTKYFDEHNFKIGKSEFDVKPKDYKLEKNEKFISKPDKNNNRKVEKIIEPGLCNDYKQRDELNIIYFLALEESLPEWPWAFKSEGMTRRFGQ